MGYEAGLGRKLVDTLPSGVPGLFNPWADTSSVDEAWNTPEIKLARLEKHLNCEPRYILCGEAPGYAGCLHSGVAFTSEKQIIGGELPRISQENRRLTKRHLPYSELSATIVWGELFSLGIAKDTILWNSVQLHPHTIENAEKNRTPKRNELEYGKPGLLLLREAFPDAVFVAVGLNADRNLKAVGINGECVRHPANGGSQAFRFGLRKIVEV